MEGKKNSLQWCGISVVGVCAIAEGGSVNNWGIMGQGRPFLDERKKSRHCCGRNVEKDILVKAP